MMASLAFFLFDYMNGLKGILFIFAVPMNLRKNTSMWNLRVGAMACLICVALHLFFLVLCEFVHLFLSYFLKQLVGTPRTLRGSAPHVIRFRAVTAGAAARAATLCGDP